MRVSKARKHESLYIELRELKYMIEFIHKVFERSRDGICRAPTHYVFTAFDIHEKIIYAVCKILYEA